MFSVPWLSPTAGYWCPGLNVRTACPAGQWSSAGASGSGQCGACQGTASYSQIGTLSPLSDITFLLTLLPRTSLTASFLHANLVRSCASLSSLRSLASSEPPAGYYCSGGTKTICPAGSYCPLGSPAPVQCPLGDFCTVGVSSPSPCLGGSYGANPGLTSSTSCTTCEAGYWCGGGTGRVQCSPGFWSRQRNTHIRVLAQVHPRFCNADPPLIPLLSYAAVLSLLSANTGESAPGACVSCPAGRVCAGGAANVPCFAGTYSVTMGYSLQSQCSPCPRKPSHQTRPLPSVCMAYLLSLGANRSLCDSRPLICFTCQPARIVSAPAPITPCARPEPGTRCPVAPWHRTARLVPVSMQPPARASQQRTASRYCSHL